LSIWYGPAIVKSSHEIKTTPMATDEDNKQQQIEELEEIVKEAEARLSQAKSMLEQVAGSSHPYVSLESQPERVIIGTFNGEYMIDEQKKKYPVPANYASKSKLVEGDQLKLTITPDGAFIYKQIGPTPRKRHIATIIQKDDKYYAQVAEDLYRLLTASVTYFRLNVGDEVTILTPLAKKSEWAAIENVISQGNDYGGEAPSSSREGEIPDMPTAEGPGPDQVAPSDTDEEASPDEEETEQVKVQPW